MEYHEYTTQEQISSAAITPKSNNEVQTVGAP